MPFIPTPLGVKVVMRFSKAGQIVCNVFHCRLEGAATEAILGTIASVFKTAWEDNLKTLTTSDTSLQAVEVTDISEVGGIGIEDTSGLPSTGTGGGELLPNNVTVATKLLTGHVGRSYRGRFFFIGPRANSLTSDKNHIDSTLQAGLVSFVETLVSELLAASVEMAIASFFHAGAPRTEGVLTAVTNASVNTTLDSQRRRLPERGA